MEKILEIRNLSKSFGSRRVLYNVSLDVHAGEILGYLGPNGSGKTTTIKLILGLLKLTHGEIRICGNDISRDFERAVERVGGIVENPEMYPYLSARENLRHYARMYSTKIDDGRIDEVLALVGLSERADEKISKYSLGMRQRLGVAQAIMHRPSLLVLDEPTNGLDPAGIKDLRDLLKRLALEEGLAVFVSSHLLSELELLCDTVAVINHGKIVGIRRVAELQSTEKEGRSLIIIEADGTQRALELLIANGISAEPDGNKLSFEICHEDIPSAVYLLAVNGVKIYSVSEQKRTLEEAFLEMTSDLRADAEGGRA